MFGERNVKERELLKAFKTETDKLEAILPTLENQANILDQIENIKDELPFHNLIKREHWRFEKNTNGDFQHPFVFWKPIESSVIPTLSFVDMSDHTQRDNLPQVVKDMLQTMLGVGWNNGSNWGRGVTFNIAIIETTGTGGLSLVAGGSVRYLGTATWGYKGIAVETGQITIAGQQISTGDFKTNLVNGQRNGDGYSWDIGNSISFDTSPSKIYIVAPFITAGLLPKNIPLIVNTGE